MYQLYRGLEGNLSARYLLRLQEIRVAEGYEAGGSDDWTRVRGPFNEEAGDGYMQERECRWSERA